MMLDGMPANSRSYLDLALPVPPCSIVLLADTSVALEHLVFANAGDFGDLHGPSFICSPGPNLANSAMVSQTPRQRHQHVLYQPCDLGGPGLHPLLIFPTALVPSGSIHGRRDALPIPRFDGREPSRVYLSPRSWSCCASLN